MVSAKYVENLAEKNIAKLTGLLFVKEENFHSLVIFVAMEQEARYHYAVAVVERE